MLAAEMLWMNIEPRNGEKYGESSENWFNKRFKIFLILTELEMISKTYQLAMLKHCIGDEILCLLKMLNFTEDIDAN